MSPAARDRAHCHPYYQAGANIYTLCAKQFKKLLTPGKIGQTLCLGNLTDKHTYEYLRSISPDLKIVKGRFDVEASSLPISQTVTHGSLRIGFIEGFTLVSNEPDLLLAEAHKLDVDVLCVGGTHRFDAFEYMDKFFVNPGSATGAYTTGWTQEGEEMVPSFCLMDVSSRRMSGTFMILFVIFGALRLLLANDRTSANSSGARYFTHTLRLPTAERRKWCRERGCRKGDVHETRRANRWLVIMAQTAVGKRCVLSPKYGWAYHQVIQNIIANQTGLGGLPRPCQRITMV